MDVLALFINYKLVISEVGLLLNGRLLPNNSVITWVEIGSGKGSLFCLTDRVDCCDSASDSGNWYLPNGNIVNYDSTSMGVYQKYGHSSILLQGGTSAVSGIFRCDVIGRNDTIQNLYIGIYSESGNSEHSQLLDMYNKAFIHCVY